MTLGGGYPGDGHEPVGSTCPKTVCCSGEVVDERAVQCFGAGNLDENPQSENEGLRFPPPKRPPLVPKGEVQDHMNGMKERCD